MSFVHENCPLSGILILLQRGLKCIKSMLGVLAFVHCVEVSATEGESVIWRFHCSSQVSLVAYHVCLHLIAPIHVCYLHAKKCHSNDLYIRHGTEPFCKNNNYKVLFLVGDFIL